MNSFNNTLSAAPAMPICSSQKADLPSTKMFAGLMAEAENYPEPTAEELAEADRILAAALAPYEAESARLREEEYRKMELREVVYPHLVDLSKPAPVVKPIIEQGGVTIASLGNISAVVGAAKSKKTFLCTALVGGLLAERGEFGITPRLAKVLWVDTEQSALHARRVVERIHRLAGWDDKRNCGMLHTLTLREVEPKERAEILYHAIELYRPMLVVVDGVSDLMYNTNDIAESDSIVGRLMSLSTEYNCHILCVLHTNPDSDKARGHIGSTLQRKAETVLFVHKVGESSVVEPQFCRNEEFEPFAFIVDENGLPVLSDMPQGQGASRNDVVRVLEEFYPNGIERMILIDRMMNELSVTYGVAQVKISRALKSGKIVSDGKLLLLP